MSTNLPLKQQFSHYILRIVAFFASVVLLCQYPTRGMQEDLIKFGVSLVLSLLVAQLVEMVTSRVVARLEYPLIFPEPLRLQLPHQEAYWAVEKIVSKGHSVSDFQGDYSSSIRSMFDVGSGVFFNDLNVSYDGFTTSFDLYVDTDFEQDGEDEDACIATICFLPEATSEDIKSDKKMRLTLIRERAYSPFVNLRVRARRTLVSTSIFSALKKAEKEWRKKDKAKAERPALPRRGDTMTQEEVDLVVKMAKKGDAEAQFLLACLYDDGNQIDQNLEKAEKYYLSAADQGHKLAQAHLALLYYPGEGSYRSNEKRFFHYAHLAAQQGVSGAMLLLAKYYYCGPFDYQDKQLAAKWWLEAAEDGWAEAQLAIALMYLRGEINTTGAKNARFWLTEAAEQGDAEAMFNLGKMYEHGFQVNQDIAQAQMWFAKAAERGHQEAATKLTPTRRV